ncbi:hypothetical protein QFZ31_005263 [Neobacillus niacini]|uniref:hypothetical protein n=1 Tax=Neobacillus driksii TaxID=3035913 RepID=UPI002780D5E9|nr:hypothetical protein [Neobacillus niacini]MDQ0975385.1 hypothetical protein [Neobacillus niacini]
MIKEKAYKSPRILSHLPIRFETAQSWNKGHGNLEHPGKGNDGIHYPNDPYTGPRPDNSDGPGNNNGKGKGK